jgi:hypothetical protein
MLGCSSWCWRLLQGMFPRCSFPDHVIDFVWLREDPFAAAEIGAHRPLARQSVLDGPACTVTCCAAFGPVPPPRDRSLGVAVRLRCHR